jgi:hypothetical protein
MREKLSKMTLQNAIYGHVLQGLGSSEQEALGSWESLKGASRGSVERPNQKIAVFRWNSRAADDRTQRSKKPPPKAEAAARSEFGSCTRSQPSARPKSSRLQDLVSVMLRLIRPFNRYTEVVGLLVAEFGEFHSELVQVQSCYFFVQVLGQHVHTEWVLFGFGPEFDLG